MSGTPAGGLSAEGALAGIKVLEFAGLGPAPFCGMLLADLGADVIRVERPGASFDPADTIQRSRRSLTLDLKADEGLSVARRLIDRVDVLLEGFRPGVMERLGLGPEDCLDRNPRLVFGRITGWGRNGPLAQTSGRDINYIALAGVLGLLGGREHPPAPPLNLVGDYGGGATFLAIGVLAALLARERDGRGQVVDASILAGSGSLAHWVRGQVLAGDWTGEREANLLDGGAPFYRAYRCADGLDIAVGAIDARDCEAFLDGLGFDADAEVREAARDRSRWAWARTEIAARVESLDRGAWLDRFRGSDGCVTPVLGLAEVAHHPQHVANQTTVEVDGSTQPAPAPRFSATGSPPPRPPRRPGSDTRAILRELDLSSAQIDGLISRAVVSDIYNRG